MLKDRFECLLIPTTGRQRFIDTAVFRPTEAFVQEYNSVSPEQNDRELLKVMDIGDTELRCSIMNVLCRDSPAAHYASARRTLLCRPAQHVHSRLKCKYSARISGSDGIMDCARIGFTKDGAECHAFFLGADLGDVLGARLYKTLPRNEHIPQVRGPVLITSSRWYDLAGSTQEIFEDVPYSALEDSFINQQIMEATVEGVQQKYRLSGLE
jgi:hypothetical protein